MTASIKVKPSWFALAILAFVLCCEPLKVFGCLAFIVTSSTAFGSETLIHDLHLALWDLLDMESKISTLLDALHSGHTDPDFALAELKELKGDIKHHQVPQSAVSSLFDLVCYALSSSHYVDTGFSILGHLTKRLVLQEQKELLIAQCLKTLPSVISSLADQRDRIRQRANQALSDFWRLSPVDVEQIIRDAALTSEISRVKEAGMRWILKVSYMLPGLDTANSSKDEEGA